MSAVVEALLGRLRDRLVDGMMDFDHNSVVREGQGCARE
jgi:hypothetical protein